MSIQSNVNQSIAVAGALYSQSPIAEERVQKKLEKKELDAIDKNIGNIAKEREAKMAVDKKHAEAVRSTLKDPNISGEAKANAILDRMAAINRSQKEGLEYLERIGAEEEKKGNITGNFTDFAETDAFVKMMKAEEEKKGNITGNFTDFAETDAFVKMMKAADKRAESKRDFKNNQMANLTKEQKYFIDNINPDLKEEALRQLTGGKK